MATPIVIELTKDADGFPKGAEFGFESEAKARSRFGDDFKIVRNQDQTPYEAPRSTTKAADASKDGKKG